MNSVRPTDDEVKECLIKKIHCVDCFLMIHWFIVIMILLTNVNRVQTPHKYTCLDK